MLRFVKVDHYLLDLLGTKVYIAMRIVNAWNVHGIDLAQLQPNQMVSPSVVVLPVVILLWKGIVFVKRLMISLSMMSRKCDHYMQNHTFCLLDERNEESKILSVCTVTQLKIRGVVHRTITLTIVVLINKEDHHGLVAVQHSDLRDDGQTTNVNLGFL